MENISLDNCFEALSKLVSTDFEGESHDYEKALQKRLDILHYWLEKAENGSMKSSFEEILQSDDFQWDGPSNINVRLSLAVLALLELLRRHLESLRTCHHPPEAPSRPGAPPLPPPDELGVRQRRTAARAVQMTVALCVLPALPAGVGVPVEQRTEHADLLRAATALHADQYQRREAAVLAVRRLLPLTADRSLSAAVLTGHASDLLALLLLVAHAPLAADGRAGMTPERRQHLLRQRRQLAPELAPLLARLPDSAAVSELLLLQRCAATSKPPRRWMHERTAWWIFQYVRRHGGLASVTEGLLQFWGQDRLDEVPMERVQAVAKLLCSPHPDFKDEKYFTHLASEVLRLLHLPRPEARVTILRVAGALAAELWRSAEGRRAAEIELLHPLLSPLSAGRPEPAAEEELSGSVTAAWQLLVVGSEPDSPCVDALTEHAAALLQLHALVRGGVSRLRAPCAELLQRLLRCGRLADARQAVESLLLGEGVGERRRFALGDSGGVRVETIPDDEADNWLVEDDGLAAAFAEILAEAAPSELVADVFVALLERMRTVAMLDRLADNADPPPRTGGTLLLDWERRQTERRRAFRGGLLTLRALAALTDNERARTGLQDAARLVPVVQTLLENFCDAADTAEPGAEPGLLQVETVCLSIGVLAGLLGSEESTAPAWTSARRLLPVLQKLVDGAGGVERVKDMAADLRTLVLTNGVVRPEDLMAGMGQGGQKTDQRVKPDPDQKPSREVLDQLNTTDERLSSTQRVKPDPDAVSDEQRGPDQPRKPLITVLDSQDNEAMDTDSSHDPAVKSEPLSELGPAAHQQLSSFDKNVKRQSTVSAFGDATSTPIHTTTSASPSPSTVDSFAASAAAAAATGPAAAAAATGDLDTGPAITMTYERAMYELVDPLLPVRAHALMTLSRLLERRDPETCRHRDKLLTVFQEKLDDDDSYVYLAAVRGLACLADRYTAQVVPVLCRQFADRSRSGDPETRLKLAEALAIMVRNLGDMAPHHAPPLLSALLTGCRDGDALVRASSLSCMADLCRLLRYSLAGHLHEVFGCLSALVDTDPAIEVRRAAVLLVSQLIAGLGADALKVLEDVLLPLYRRLKVLLRREEDPALLHHVHTALDALESATRQMLFPPAPRTLQKRIVVLDPPS